MQSIDMISDEITEGSNPGNSEQHDIKLLIASLIANTEALTTTVKALASEVAEPETEEKEEPEEKEVE